MYWHRAYLSAGVIAALTIGTLAAAATKPAVTASSGRTWKVTSGKYAGEHKGELLTVKNCEVTLILNEKESVTDIGYQQIRKWGYTITKPVPVTHTDSYTETVRLPLKLLSKQDRLWVEKDHASECALSKRSVIGDIGVFATKDGAFYVDKKIDSKTAVIALVVDAETTWTFVLKSSIVNAMKEDPTHAGKGDESLGQKNKLDFILKERKTFDEVRFPLFMEAD
jgi:hypothetical protein